MAGNPVFIKKVAKAIQLFKDGKLEEAREEFATNRLTCEKMAKASKNTEYWENMAGAMQTMVDVTEKKMRGEPFGSGLSKSKKDRIDSDLQNIIQDLQGEESGIQYQDGVGQEEKTVDEGSTEEVVQDRIEFLEDEVRKSEATLMELKQELDELKDEKEEK